MRPETSTAPPAVKPTVTRISRDGYFDTSASRGAVCACAPTLASITQTTTAVARILLIMLGLLVFRRPSSAANGHAQSALRDAGLSFDRPLPRRLAERLIQRTG